MTADPKKSLASVSLSEIAKSDVHQLLQTGLADFSLRELLGLLISTAGTAERSLYLEKEPTDKPNGFYDRSLPLGTIPIEVRVPRTRTGGVPAGDFAFALSSRLQPRSPVAAVGIARLEPLDPCSQRRTSEDGPVQLGTGSGTGGNGNDRGAGTAQQPAFGSRPVGCVCRWQVRRMARW